MMPRGHKDVGACLEVAMCHAPLIEYVLGMFEGGFRFAGGHDALPLCVSVCLLRGDWCCELLTNRFWSDIQ